MCVCAESEDEAACCCASEAAWLDALEELAALVDPADAEPPAASSLLTAGAELFEPPTIPF